MSSYAEKIPSYKDLILDFLQKEIFTKKISNTKEILLRRKNTFFNEYIQMNNISISTTCSVKTDNIYKTGYLILKNNKLVIHQYDSNKTSPIIRFNNSLDETVDIFHPIFFIDFNMVTCELIIHKTKQKFRLIILGKNLTKKDYENDKDYIYRYRVVKFSMPHQSNEVFKLICEKINKSIILSKGYKYNIFSINLRKNFCKEFFINYKQFPNEGNTGDILLFKGYSNESKRQRFITNEEFDHVALLVRNKTGLNVFESTGKEGVKLRPWQEFITYYWYLLYDVMAFRKLIIDENAMNEFIINQTKEIKNEEEINKENIKENFWECFNSKIEEFISKTENKKYTFSKIGFLCESKMKKNSVIRNKYSCSELIAACYYYIGIITDQLEARNYLPGNYSRNGIVHFKKGFKLGKQYIIDFSSSLTI